MTRETATAEHTCRIKSCWRKSRTHRHQLCVPRTVLAAAKTRNLLSAGHRRWQNSCYGLLKMQDVLAGRATNTTNRNVWHTVTRNSVQFGCILWHGSSGRRVWCLLDNLVLSTMAGLHVTAGDLTAMRPESSPNHKIFVCGIPLEQCSKFGQKPFLPPIANICCIFWEK